MHKGRVSGTGSDRRWYIDKVTKVICYKSKCSENVIKWWIKAVEVLGKSSVSGESVALLWSVCFCQVTYEDQGTYTQRDYWNKEISTVKVAVTRELAEGCISHGC